MIYKRRPGLGNVHENINCRQQGIDPYKTFYHFLTPFGKIIFIDGPRFTEGEDVKTHPSMEYHLPDKETLEKYEKNWLLDL